MTQQAEQTPFRRPKATQRFEHLVLTVAFIGLALTGLPQRYVGEAWSQTIIQALGGIESVRILHRFLAALLIAEGMYHVTMLCYKLIVLRQPADRRPRVGDLRDLRDSVLYNLGLKPESPRMEPFNLSNKYEYLFIVISVFILLVTGLALWNPIATAALLPGEVIPISQAVHSDQALLAVLVVAIWHTYNVLIRRVNSGMVTGKQSRPAGEERGAAFDPVEQSLPALQASPASVRGRRRVFWPVAIDLILLVIVGMVIFLLFKQTSITTVPRREILVFAPQFPPASGDAKVGAALWPTLRCANCHGPQAGGGPNGAPALLGTRLTFEEFYQQVRKGADTMPAFGPEELPDGYALHLWTWLSTSQPAIQSF